MDFGRDLGFAPCGGDDFAPPSVAGGRIDGRRSGGHVFGDGGAFKSWRTLGDGPELAGVAGRHGFRLSFHIGARIWIRVDLAQRRRPRNGG